MATKLIELGLNETRSGGLNAVHKTQNIILVNGTFLVRPKRSPTMESSDLGFDVIVLAHVRVRASFEPLGTGSVAAYSFVVRVR